MKLSIITINFNNADGLKKTLDSVAAQDLSSISSLHSNLSTLISPLIIEHIIVDGGSTDGSVDVIKDYESCIVHRQLPIVLRWVSEKDSGIYNAMNKGIQIAMGNRGVDSFNRSELVEDKNKGIEIAMGRRVVDENHYLQFLNSGDMLANDHVIFNMFTAMEENQYPDILYGNMQKVLPDGTKLKDVCGATHSITLNMFYRGCLNHSPAYIKQSLFDEYGYYDETLQICSDWKFYMQSIVLGHATVRYTNQLVTIFDMGGISETRKDILNEERNRLLREMIPQGILKDYDKYHFPMSQYDRLKRHHLWGIVYFVERVLFKLEKWHIL